MVGNIPNGHASGQFDGVAFQGVGVVLLGIGKGDLDLAMFATSAAPEAWHFEVDVGRLFADGEGPKGAFDAALGPDVMGTAVGAAEAIAWLLDAKVGRILDEVLANLVVADDTETAIE